MSETIYIDLHVVQTVPPSCLNRDDTGSPKTAIYGGVQRARVSSQSWKRAVRKMFKENLDEAELGTRTKKIVEMVAERIEANSEFSHERAMELAESIIGAAGVKTAANKKTGVQEAQALFFMSDQQAMNLANLVLTEENASKKQAQEALNQGHGIDVALFGRMVADDPSLNADASAQVAHAISTHRVDIEYDYFTAVDDRAPEDNAGAGMIGTVEFDSATLYRYATVAVHELFGQLAENTEATARAMTEFTKAFVNSMPTGKQNTFANRTPADAVLVCIRTDQPINLVGAFEETVKAKSDESGFVAQSIDKLSKYNLNVISTFVDAPMKSWCIGADIDGAEKLTDMATLLASISDFITQTFSSAASSEA